MKKTVLREYARLLAQRGVNVQKGQEVFIFTGLEQPEFVQMVTEECYKAGASKVVVEWDYQPLARVHNRYRSLKTMSTLNRYELARWEHMAEVLPCRLILDSEDPDGLKGMNQEKAMKARQRLYPVIKPFRDRMENRQQWCIAAVPGVKWAKKLFPELPKGKAVEKLWEEILTASRAMEEPLKAWEQHSAEIQRRCAYLNSLNIRSLHYTASNGTDLTVGMIEQAHFCGGSEKTLGGVEFEPNIPTEECFISPKRGEAEGIVYSTMPLCSRGQLIENFSIRFEKGRAVEWHAEKNEELLTQIIEMDEGSHYLGECALVPYDSPIRTTGILFYNTLFDENAACHLALGMGFPDTINDFEHKTLDEVHALGVNDSMVHEDFMIGSKDMNIDAVTADGRTVPIFRDGTWAFECE
ncbi:MAG: aminopeptidase [Clostridia bacterium]|nr:aminopeptidase [Clostridia bacterium]